MAKSKRTVRTPAERAIAGLGVEQRRVEKLEAKRKTHMVAVQEINTELESAIARRDYLAKNPDLPEADTDPIPAVDGDGS